MEEEVDGRGGRRRLRVGEPPHSRLILSLSL
jgi:hypothetical protein